MVEHPVHTRVVSGSIPLAAILFHDLVMYSYFSTFLFLSLLTAAAGSLWAETNFQVFFQDKTKYQDVLVSDVYSPDTIELESGEKIRLIGLRASDNLKKRKKSIEYDEDGNVIEHEPDAEEVAVTPIEEQALKYITNLLLGKRVRLEFDDQKKTDHYDATFAYVYLIENNTFVNLEILRQGFAFLQIIPPNMKFAEELRAAYRQAREERRGLQNE